jgi:hypothetical protein
VTGSGHPLNGGLGGYYQDKLSWVPWVAGYAPKLQDTTGSLQWNTAGGPYTPYQEVTLPLEAEEMGPSN